jgi:hypothetical protein
MTTRLDCMVIDALDTVAPSTHGSLPSGSVSTVYGTVRSLFWSAAAGWPVTHGGPHYTAVRSPTGRGPYLELLRTTEPNVVKNRLHLDVTPQEGMTKQSRSSGCGR